MGHKSVCHYGMPITGSWPFLAWSLPQVSWPQYLWLHMKPIFSKSWSKNQEIKTNKSKNQEVPRLSQKSVICFEKSVICFPWPFCVLLPRFVDVAAWWAASWRHRCPSSTGHPTGRHGHHSQAPVLVPHVVPVQVPTWSVEIKDLVCLFVFSSWIPNWSCFFFFQLLKLQLWQSIIQLAKPLLAALEDWERRKIQMARQC